MLLIILPACTSLPAASRPATPVAGPTHSLSRTPSAEPAQGPIRALDGVLVDATGHEVRLTGVNWFGLETSAFAPHGLWARNWEDMLDQIAKAGFNTIRLPFSNELFDDGVNTPNGIDYTKNPDLVGLKGLGLLDRIIQGAAGRGLKVILDRHQPTAEARTELWYTDRVPEARWIADWEMLARHYQGNPAVIGADLHNEPHGSATWGDGNPRTDWRLAAERAGNAILSVNPDWLIFVEGIENYHGDYYWWGGNLAGATQYPVRLSRPDRLVYSAHDYGPGVSWQPWFQAADFPRNLPGLWLRHWAYLKDQRLAPVLIGEFGGRSVGQDTEGIWQRSLVGFLRANGFSYAYWSWNPNSGDTGGILEDDWTTLNRAKLEVLSAYQWPALGEAPAGQPTPASHVSGAYRWP